jgi:hypothetical protein
MTAHDNHATDFVFPEWARAPLRRCDSRLTEEVRFLHLSMAGLGQLAKRPQAIEVLLSLEEQYPTSEDEKKELTENLAAAKREAAWVEEETSRGFPLLHAHSIAAIWGILEVVIEEVAMAWLSSVPTAWRATAIQKLKLSIGEYEAIRPEDRARYVTSELSRALTGGVRNGISKLEPLLEAFDLAPTLKPNLRKALLELYQVRNVIVHCGSRVDQRLLEVCPWVSWPLGAGVLVEHGLYAWYQKAAGRYTERLRNQVVVALGGPACTCPGMDEIQDRPTIERAEGSA